ncbi:MAG TPA: TonB family protein [Planctomycetota bacterium]|nr:TonB family protein [Planctomycetota bacterium]
MDPRTLRPTVAPAFGRSLVLSFGLHAAAFGAALLVAFGPSRGVNSSGPTAVVVLADAELDTAWTLAAPPEEPVEELESPELPTPELVPVEEPLEALERALEPDDAPLVEPLFDWSTTRADARPIERLEPRPAVAELAPAPPSEPASAPAPRGEDRPLQLVHGPPPAYPRLALRLQQQGDVLLELEVDAAGRVVAVHMLESSGFERLDEAARQTVLAWRFEPALRDGEPVPERFRHRIQFVLES